MKNFIIVLLLLIETFFILSCAQPGYKSPKKAPKQDAVKIEATEDSAIIRNEDYVSPTGLYYCIITMCGADGSDICYDIVDDYGPYKTLAECANRIYELRDEVKASPDILKGTYNFKGICSPVPYTRKINES